LGEGGSVLLEGTDPVWAKQRENTQSVVWRRFELAIYQNTKPDPSVN